MGYGCDSADYSCVQDMYSSIHSPIGFENINGDIYTSNVAVLNEVSAVVPSSLGNNFPFINVVARALKPSGFVSSLLFDLYPLLVWK